MPTATKRKAPGKLATPVARAGVKIPNKSTIDESNTTVSGAEAVQADTIEISSGEEDEYSSGDDEMADAPVAAIKAATNNGGANKADSDEDAEDGDDDNASPSFGELLRGNDPIDVTALLAQPITAGNGAVARSSKAVVNPVSHRSLTATLTQALKSDDTDLLESCLNTGDLPTIRNTIEEIDSTYAGMLLTKLAARLYRRPGRAGNLMTWVQWTIIAHGGALASQPKVVQGLAGLQKVLAERAKGLNSLLTLKGKLDLLQGQMELRRKMQVRGGAEGEDEDDEDEDEHVIWVEGEDAVAADDDDSAAPLTNGHGAASDDEDDDEDAGADEDESVEGEDLDENEVAYDDAEDSMGEDDESDAEPAPPSKLQKIANVFRRS